jgi:Flp pilus assembly pilin Flp
MNNIKRFINEEEGMGTVELVLIIVVLIALVLIFKAKIIEFVTSILDKITTNGDTV